MSDLETFNEALDLLGSLAKEVGALAGLVRDMMPDDPGDLEMYANGDVAWIDAQEREHLEAIEHKAKQTAARIEVMRGRNKAASAATPKPSPE